MLPALILNPFPHHPYKQIVVLVPHTHSIIHDSPCL
jgi:hypothetical protein